MSETVAVSRTAHTFGERFEALLRQNHETSAAAAAKLGVSVAIVAKWRLGKVIPSGEYLVKIANAYQVSIDYLLDIADKPYQETSEEEVSEYTGLKADAIEVLHRICSSSKSDDIAVLYNFFSSENIDCIFELLGRINESSVRVRTILAKKDALGDDSKYRVTPRLKLEKRILENRICEMLVYIGDIIIEVTKSEQFSPQIRIEPKDPLSPYTSEATMQMIENQKMDENGNFPPFYY